MKIIAPFDPSVSMSGSIDPGVVNPCGRIYLFNESPIGVTLTLADGSTASLPPYFYRSYVIRTPGLITWSQFYTLQNTGAVSRIFGESYESGEAKTLTFTEGPLNRQTNLGNSIPVSNSSNSVVNDGNAASTNIVEATVSGDSASAVVLTNDGSLKLGNVTRNGSVTLTGTATVTDLIVSSGHIGQAASADVLDAGTATTYLKGQAGVNIQVPNGTSRVELDSSTVTVSENFHVTGTSQFDQRTRHSQGITFPISSGNGKIYGDLGNQRLLIDMPDGTVIFRMANDGSIHSVGDISLGNNGTSKNVLDAIANGNTYLKSSQGVNFQVPNGTSVASADGGGLHVLVGKLNLLVGALSRISTFSGTSVSGTVSIAHNLGTTPDICIVMMRSQSSSTTYSVDWNSTNCIIYAFNGGIPFVGVALKF